MTATIIPRLLSVAIVIAFAFNLAGTASGQPAPAQADTGTSPLPAGAGRDLVLSRCSVCHQPDVVAHQQLTREGWTELVDQMANQGASASDDEFAQIIDYLATSFPAQP